MLSKTSVVMLGALAAWQGVAAQVKPQDQAVADGNLPLSAAQLEDAECGALQGDDVSKPCTLEQKENAKLVGLLPRDGPDAAQARKWLGEWQRASRLHAARDCCIQCKVDVYRKDKTAGLPPSTARWFRDTFYSRDAYLAAWNQPGKTDFADVLAEWKWRSEHNAWPAPTAQTEAEAGFVRRDDCGALSALPAAPVPLQAANRTVVFNTAPVVIRTVDRAGEVKPYIQPRFVTATISATGVEGCTFAGPAEKVEPAQPASAAPRVEAEAVAKIAIPIADCAVCRPDAPAKPAEQVVAQPATAPQVQAMKSEVLVRGRRSANPLVLLEAKAEASVAVTGSPAGNPSGLTRVAKTGPAQQGQPLRDAQSEAVSGPESGLVSGSASASASVSVSGPGSDADEDGAEEVC